jgi:hypothetical protein
MKQTKIIQILDGLYNDDIIGQYEYNAMLKQETLVVLLCNDISTKVVTNKLLALSHIILSA